MDPIKTGKLISERRKAEKMTQARLAEILHVSKNAVSKWERGLNFPDTGIMQELCSGCTFTVPFRSDCGRHDTVCFTAQPHDDLYRIPCIWE